MTHTMVTLLHNGDYSALFSKSYRIWRILHNPNLRQVDTSNKALFKIIGAMLLFVTVHSYYTGLLPSSTNHHYLRYFSHLSDDGFRDRCYCHV
jgi:hypothetical protein